VSRRRGPAVAAVLMLVAQALACEKETQRAARKAFQEILARDRQTAEQAAALETFVQDFPEPKTNPYLVRACSMLADYHARAGRADIAASWYERAIRADPEDPDLLNALGFHYARNGMNLDRAVSVLEEAVRLAEKRRLASRRQGFIKDSLGWAYRMRGDLPLAVALLEESSRLAPGTPIIRQHLADAYHAIGERDKAVSVYLDLYLAGRGTDPGLRGTLRAIGREGGPVYARQVGRRIAEGLGAIQESDRKEAEASGASLMHLVSADGHRLVGSLFPPRDRSLRGSGSAPGRTAAVLLLHPLGSSRASCAPEAGALAARGLYALTLDVRGHGGSVSESLPDAHAFSARLADSLRGADADVRAALQCLARQPRVDAGRIGIVGAGLGAFLAARALQADPPSAPARPGSAFPRPVALVLLSPWGRADAYTDLLGRLAPGSVLLLAGSEEGAPLATVKALAAPGSVAAPRSLVVDGHGAHFDLVARRPDLVDVVAGFLVGRLVPAAGSTGVQSP